MGVAVILLSVLIRIVLIPVMIAGDRNEKERHDIAKRAKEIEEKYATDTVQMNKEIKKLFKTNPRIIFAEMVDLVISVLVTILLIRIFATGIEGADLHLLYKGMPYVARPYNLIFLGKFDLSRPNFILNITQSFVILVVEIVAEFASPFHNLISKEHIQAPQLNAITRVKDNYVDETKNRVRSLQVLLPIVSFIIFAFLPAGKKLFIITTLLFSLFYMLIKIVRRKLVQTFPAPSEPLAVEVLKPLDDYTTPH